MKCEGVGQGTDATRMDFNVIMLTNVKLQEGEVSTVEVTRRMSEERDLQPHGNNSNHSMTMSAEDKERRLQRWKDKLGPRDDSETAVMTASGANAIKVRRDRPSRNEPESVVMALVPTFIQMKQQCTQD